ncbi:Tryp_alpha_amyl domain-containing protein [Cephalotus follicularis]|uniref:Non-specific lipid-transfer protein n=1 Tax=Cephalotus follicularis TaxID=3775 RepID=A0A1Q3CAB0_CEPFO|nr:Tryp_alpha_amyl domain-containing protein [Cephalotus follicularis]
MAGSSIALKLACVVVMCLLVAAPLAQAGISCGQVVSKMTSCINYLKNGGSVPEPCCAGVKSLNNAARTTPDRQTACGCLKNAYNQFPGIKPAIAAGLPGKCGVNIPYKISPSTDCSKVR